jgi:hypothetical protein
MFTKLKNAVSVFFLTLPVRIKYSWARFKVACRAVVLHRMAPALYISVGLFAVIGISQPQLLSVSIYKLSLITSGAWLAYWLDRWLFPYARPDALLDLAWSVGAPITVKGFPTDPVRMQAFVGAMQRRALIVVGAMIAVALGA